jgi:hypothetical protein
MSKAPSQPVADSNIASAICLSPFSAELIAALALALAVSS